MSLVNSLRPHIAPKAKSFRADTVNAEKKVAMSLYYMKDQGSYRMTANTFGVSTATLSVILRQTCQSLIEKMGAKMIKFPETVNGFKEAAVRFESKFGIPQVIGCNFFCYKMKYSFNCQAICDEKGLFIDIDLRWPGSVHDARVYANCLINKKFKEKVFPPVYNELIPGRVPVPPILLGDPAYPLLPNVMKEFNTCVDGKQLNFNNSLRSARNQIERAFGRLNARWRILNRSLDVDMDFAIKLTYACFLLHNLCEINKIEIHPDLVQKQIRNEQRCQACAHHNIVDKLHSYNSSRGKLVRDVIAEYLYDD